jgi:hypothetical protein
MVWKAKVNLGPYGPGMEVPADKAELWRKMYDISPVEWVEESTPKPITKPVEPIKNNLDLNNDGKVDAKDAKIASKVMNYVRKK